MRRITLVVAEHGSFVGKRGDRIVVRPRGGPAQEYSVRSLELILVTGRGVTVSNEALKLACSRGVPVFFAYPSGYPYAAVMPAVSTGSADTRREQILAKYDHRGTELAREFVRGKLVNQASLLRSAALSRGRTDPALADKLVAAAEAISDLAEEAASVSGALDGGAGEALRSIEGRAGKLYWTAFSLMVPSELGFPGRVKRGARDVVNCLLNFGYGYLRVRVTAAIFYAGLDAYAGFLHVDRAGRASLALDLMEEFRPLVVDRAVLTLIARNQVSKRWLSPSRELSKEAISSILEALAERMDSKVGTVGRRVKISTAIRRQAVAIVSHLKGTGRYRAVTGW